MKDNIWLKTILMNLFKDNKNAKEIYNANIDVEKVKKLRDKIDMAADYALKKIREENQQRKVVVMIDAPRQDIYNGTLSSSNIAWMHRLLKAKCEKYNVYFLDLTDDFAALYKKDQRKFESQYDNHWNEHGHECAAKSLVNFLRKNNII
jgi:hypothetical protein